MSASVGIAVVAVLFMLFPLASREAKSRRCGTRKCMKKRIGFSCTRCPNELERGSLKESTRANGKPTRVPPSSPWGET